MAKLASILLAVAAAGAIVENGKCHVPFQANEKDGKNSTDVKAGGFVTTGTLPYLGVEAVEGKDDQEVFTLVLSPTDTVSVEDLAAAFAAGTEFTYASKLPKPESKADEAKLDQDLIDTLHAYKGIKQVYLFGESQHFFSAEDVCRHLGVTELPKSVKVLDADSLRQNHKASK